MSALNSRSWEFQQKEPACQMAEPSTGALVHAGCRGYELPWDNSWRVGSCDWLRVDVETRAKSFSVLSCGKVKIWGPKSQACGRRV